MFASLRRESGPARSKIRGLATTELMGTRPALEHARARALRPSSLTARHEYLHSNLIPAVAKAAHGGLCFVLITSTIKYILVRMLDRYASHSKEGLMAKKGGKGWKAGVTHTQTGPTEVMCEYCQLPRAVTRVSGAPGSTRPGDYVYITHKRPQSTDYDPNCFNSGKAPPHL